MSGRNKLGALLAILTCPCHIVMLGFVLTGTVVGTWLWRCGPTWSSSSRCFSFSDCG